MFLMKYSSKVLEPEILEKIHKAGFLPIKLQIFETDKAKNSKSLGFSEMSVNEKRKKQ